VYFRVYSEKEQKEKRSRQDIANNVTFMVSALWHGFYPGYFIAFFHWSLVTIVAKSCYKTTLNYPNFNYENILYKIVRFVVNVFVLNYLGLCYV